jgi:hypothetical protein
MRAFLPDLRRTISAAGLLAVALALGAQAHADDDDDISVSDDQSDTGGEWGDDEQGSSSSKSAADPDSGASDTLLLSTDADQPNANEVTTSGVYNWRVKKASPSKWPKGTTFSWRTAPKWGGSTATSAPDMIALHETGAPSGFSNETTGIHFVVERDGTVFQLGPLWKRYGHIGQGVHARSIGIEIANGQGGFNIVSDSGADRVKLQWYGANGKYLLLSPPAQLEAVSTLVSTLISQLGITSDWINESIVPGHFIVSTQAVVLDSKLFLRPGIVSHSLVPTKEGSSDYHNDGAAASIYTWLRLVKREPKQEAYCKMKEILQQKPRTLSELPAADRGKFTASKYAKLAVLRIPDTYQTCRTGGGSAGGGESTEDVQAEEDTEDRQRPGAGSSSSDEGSSSSDEGGGDSGGGDSGGDDSGGDGASDSASDE